MKFDDLIETIDALDDEGIKEVVDWQLTESPAACAEGRGPRSLGERMARFSRAAEWVTNFEPTRPRHPVWIHQLDSNTDLVIPVPPEDESFLFRNCDDGRVVPLDFPRMMVYLRYHFMDNITFAIVSWDSPRGGDTFSLAQLDAYLEHSHYNGLKREASAPIDLPYGYRLQFTVECGTINAYVMKFEEDRYGRFSCYR